jgi:hypothetical protein
VQLLEFKPNALANDVSDSTLTRHARHSRNNRTCKMQSSENGRSSRSLEQTAIDKLKSRICKLRWIGHHDEAEEAQLTLRQLAGIGRVATSPRDTD